MALFGPVLFIHFYCIERKKHSFTSPPISGALKLDQLFICFKCFVHVWKSCYINLKLTPFGCHSYFPVDLYNLVLDGIERLSYCFTLV